MMDILAQRITWQRVFRIKERLVEDSMFGQLWSGLMGEVHLDQLTHESAGHVNNIHLYSVFKM